MKENEVPKIEKLKAKKIIPERKICLFKKKYGKMEAKGSEKERIFE